MSRFKTRTISMASVVVAVVTLPLHASLAQAGQVAAAATRPDPVVVTNPVTIANPVSTVTVGNTVPVTGAVSISNTPTVIVANPSSAVTVSNTVPVTGKVEISALPPVQIGIPAQPYFVQVYGDGAAEGQVFGSTASGIAVTSILITNQFPTQASITLVDAIVTDPAACVNGMLAPVLALSGGDPHLYLQVDANRSEQFTFPTPVVFHGVNGGGTITCLQAYLPTGVVLHLSGFLF